MEQQQFTAWNGHAYPWPPPPGWQQAPDGRWWPGPGPATPPPAPAARPAAPGRGLPVWAWIGLLVLFLLVGFPLLAAFLQGFATGFAGQ